MTDTNPPEHEPPAIWLITANVIEERKCGEGGHEMRRGTKHFRGGAKVYIVGAYWGMCESVIVIGHHRASGKYVQMTLQKRYLENLRMKLCCPKDGESNPATLRYRSGITISGLGLQS